MELFTETKFRVEFYDVDSMEVVWHGNYVKYMEIARCDLLNKIGYGYKEMVASGYVFPVATMNLKYIRSLYFGKEYIIKAVLAEYENRIKIKYEIRDAETGEITTKAESTQMAMKMDSNEAQFVCPEIFTDKVKALINS